MNASVLSARGITKNFGPFTGLVGVDVDVARGEIIAVIGPSGCGKSTLLRCLAQLEEPNSGTILLDGEPFGSVAADGRRQSARTIDRLRPKVGFVFQSLNLWPHMSARDNVAKGLISVRRLPATEARDRAHALIARFGLAAKADRRPADLSGGERQRIAICRALAMEPVVLLFDEPTSALDPELVLGVRDILRELSRTGMGMMIATHDLRFAHAATDRIIFLDRGRIAEQGSTQATLDDPQSSRLRAFIKSVNHI